MDGARPLTLRELARLVAGRLVSGAPDATVRGALPAEMAGPDDVTLVVSQRYARVLGDRRVGVVLVPRGRAIPGRPCIEVDDPRRAFDRVLRHFAPEPWQPGPGIDPAAVVAPDAVLDGADVRIGACAVVGHRVRLGRGVVVYPGAVVADDVEIGDESVVGPRAVVRERVKVGRRVRIGAGAVIGSEGFGFERDPASGAYVRRPQIGTVVLEDDVEVGANACIDRAASGATVVGRGTKVDNLVQVAHNVRIGADTLVIALVGIAGSSSIGSRVILAGQAGVTDHVSVGDGAIVAGRSMIIDDVPSGARMAGVPAMPHQQALRVWAATRRLPEMMRRLEDVERRLDELGRRLDGVAGPDQGGASGEGASDS